MLKKCLLPIKAGECWTSGSVRGLKGECEGERIVWGEGPEQKKNSVLLNFLKNFMLNVDLNKFW